MRAFLCPRHQGAMDLGSPLVCFHRVGNGLWLRSWDHGKLSIRFASPLYSFPAQRSCSELAVVVKSGADQLKRRADAIYLWLIRYVTAVAASVQMTTAPVGISTIAESGIPTAYPSSATR